MNQDVDIILRNHWRLLELTKCEHGINTDDECTQCNMDKRLLLAFQNDKSHTEELAK